MENRVLEYRPFRLLPWNFGTGILSETVLTAEKTIFRKTRKKDIIWSTARSYTVRHYLQQIWEYKEISGSPHATFQWRILISDFPCHGLSPNRNEYSSWHSVDTSHVLEHGTSGYARILEEYVSISWDFSTAIRLTSHSRHKREENTLNRIQPWKLAFQCVGAVASYPNKAALTHGLRNVL